MRFSRTVLVSSLLSLWVGCAAAPADDLEGAEGKEDRGGKVATPFILHHGFNASPESDWGWNEEIQTRLVKRGARVFISQVNPYQRPEVRGEELSAFIDSVLSQTGAAKVHLIAHSQGGLDARFVASPDGLARGGRIRSITTISTPHHGTFIADSALGIFASEEDRKDAEAAKAVHLTQGGLPKSAADCIASIQSKSLNAQANAYCDRGECDLQAALGSMAESKIEGDFNARYSDDSRVLYQSYAGVSNVAGVINPQDADACEGTLPSALRDIMSISLKPVAAFVAHGWKFIPNDGVVTVESAKYGVFRGCIRADHRAEVGQGSFAGNRLYAGFDVFAFYETLTDELRVLK